MNVCVQGSIIKDLKAKAWSKNVEKLESDNMALFNVQSNMSTQIDVALRFVEWFSSRGEAYEQNFQIMEKHLAGLAHASRPYAPHLNSKTNGGRRYT